MMPCESREDKLNVSIRLIQIFDWIVNQLPV